MPPGGATLSAAAREILVLTLPPDSGLARIVRRVASHFLRQNGRRARPARAEARLVERGCATLLRASGRTGAVRRGRGARRALILRLEARAGAFVASVRAGSAPARRLLRLPPERRA